MEAVEVEEREIGLAARRRWCRPARWSSSQTCFLVKLVLEKVQIHHLLAWTFISTMVFSLLTLFISVHIGEAQTFHGGSSNAKSW